MTNETIEFLLYCHTCGTRTGMIVDKAESRGGSFDVIPCSHCKQNYVIHWHPQFKEPKVYRLAATRSFLTRIEEKEEEHGDSTDSKTEAK